MIKYLQDLQAFILRGKSYAYTMYVNKADFLQHLHYGADIEDTDIEYMISVANRLSPNPDNINFDMSLQQMPTEYGTYAHGDFHDPSVILEREDGAAMSRLRYVAYEISAGAPTLEGLPQVRTADSTLKITLKDDFSDIEIDLYYTVCDNSDVLTRYTVFRNVGKQEAQIKKGYSFCYTLPHGEYSSMRLGGRWAQERMVEVAPIAHGITRLQTLCGASSHTTHPFMAIFPSDCTEQKGECYGIQLCYSGSFALTAEQTTDCALRVQGGINEVGFSWLLQAGESFTTPQALLCYSAEGFGGMSRAYADFLRERIIPPAYAYKRRPIVLNSWEATYFDFNTEKLLPIIDAAGEIGVDTFVLDDGWFGERTGSHAGLGDWFVNEERLPGGLAPVIARCKKNGLKFGLWFEPEMVNEDSELYRAHPDWAIKHANVEPCRSRNQLVLDFSRKEVVDYVYDAVYAVLANNDISYVKWDMNRNITECYSHALDARRQGELMHRYILGVYSLAERLTSAFPEILFEGCAGGGGRFDAGALYYFPQIWTSDDTDGFERTKIQWGTSTCYPLSSMSCHVSVCPNHQTQRITPLSTRGAIASLGATGYELDVSKLTEEEKSEVRGQIAAYKEIDRLVLEGDLYRLRSPFESNYFCVMVMSKDKKEGYVVGERIHALPCDFDQTICLQGLAEGKRYKIQELEVTATGKALQNVGVLLPRKGDYGSWVWHIKECSEE